MKFLQILFIVIGLLTITLVPVTLTAQTPDDQVPAESAVPTRTAEIGFKEAIILGVVEGLTEFLPVSSTGHLIITNAFLNLDDDTPIDEKGTSVKSIADAYAIIIQIGAIFAVLVIYWNKVWQIFLGILGLNPIGRRLARNLIIAFLPAVFLGLLLDSWIEYHLFAPLPIAIALIVGGLLMLAVENWRRTQSLGDPTEIELDALGVKQCLMIGILQCFAMWPGLSRSMITIVGGYIAGLSPVKAAEFSFLLGLITLSAASCYRMFSHGEVLLANTDLAPVLVGIVLSFICAAISVKWMVSYLTRHGLALFAWYRFALGAAVIYLLVL